MSNTEGKVIKQAQIWSVDSRSANPCHAHPSSCRSTKKNSEAGVGAGEGLTGSDTSRGDCRVRAAGETPALSLPTLPRGTYAFDQVLMNIRAERDIFFFYLVSNIKHTHPRMDACLHKYSRAAYWQTQTWGLS